MKGAALVVVLVAVVAGVVFYRYGTAARDFEGQGMMGRRRSAAAPDIGDPVHGRQIADTTCVACHGLTGTSLVGEFPNLAGQKADYLTQELDAFRTGTRSSPVMQPIAASLSDTDIADVVAFYHQQTPRADAATDPGLIAGGRRIYDLGLSASVPACASCHEPGATGMMGGGMMGRGMPMMGMGSTAIVPQIRSQHAAYVVAQLERLATGARPASVMGAIAAGLTGSERRAVAAWLAQAPAARVP
jgi:cytochrome c553